MVSFRTGAARAASVSTSRPGTHEAAAPITGIDWADRRPGSDGLPADAAIRREFEALAGRIRTLQRRAAREAAALSAR